MKKFSKIMESKDLSYKTFFGKLIDHNTALKKSIRASLLYILMDERKISEKDFVSIDELCKEVDNKLDDEKIFKEISDLYKTNKRINYIAEILYDEKFK